MTGISIFSRLHTPITCKFIDRRVQFLSVFSFLFIPRASRSLTSHPHCQWTRPYQLHRPYSSIAFYSEWLQYVTLRTNRSPMRKLDTRNTTTVAFAPQHCSSQPNRYTSIARHSAADRLASESYSKLRSRKLGLYLVIFSKPRTVTIDDEGIPNTIFTDAPHWSRDKT